MSAKSQKRRLARRYPKAERIVVSMTLDEVDAAIYGACGVVPWPTISAVGVDYATGPDTVTGAVLCIQTPDGRLLVVPGTISDEEFHHGTPKDEP